MATKYQKIILYHVFIKIPFIIAIKLYKQPRNKHKYTIIFAEN